MESMRSLLSNGLTTPGNGGPKDSECTVCETLSDAWLFCKHKIPPRTNISQPRFSFGCNSPHELPQPFNGKGGGEMRCVVVILTHLQHRLQHVEGVRVRGHVEVSRHALHL